MTTTTRQFNNFGKLATKLRVAVGAIVEDWAHMVEDQIKLEMSQPKTGKIYEKGKGHFHQASAPGEAPAIDTTRLIESIQTEMTTPTEAIVETDVEYAPELEFGCIRQHGEILPRPVWIPAVEEVRNGFIADLSNLEPRLR